MASQTTTSYSSIGKTPGAWLRDARLAKNLLVRQIAALADVEPSHLNKVELDQRPPAAHALPRLANAYGVDLAELKRRLVVHKLREEFADDPDQLAATAQQLQEEAAAYRVNKSVNKPSKTPLTKAQKTRV